MELGIVIVSPIFLKKKDNTGELLFQGNYVLLVFNDIDKTAVLFCLFVYVFHTKIKTTKKKQPKKIKLVELYYI